jgi:hypothetical protein
VWTDIKFTLAVSDLYGVGLCKSDTVWLDPLVASMFCVVNASFTSDARTFIERIEYLSEIPSALPVLPRTALVINLSDPKYNIFDDTGNLIPAEMLVSDQVSGISSTILGLVPLVQPIPLWTSLLFPENLQLLAAAHEKIARVTMRAVQWTSHFCLSRGTSWR